MQFIALRVVTCGGSPPRNRGMRRLARARVQSPTRSPSSSTIWSPLNSCCVVLVLPLVLHDLVVDAREQARPSCSNRPASSARTDGCGTARNSAACRGRRAPCSPRVSSDRDLRATSSPADSRRCCRARRSVRGRTDRAACSARCSRESSRGRRACPSHRAGAPRSSAGRPISTPRNRRTRRAPSSCSINWRALVRTSVGHEAPRRFRRGHNAEQIEIRAAQKDLVAAQAPTDSSAACAAC